MSMADSSEMLHGMDTMEALSLMSENDKKYRIIFDVGRAEASRRQQVAGEGDVTNRGYERVVSHELFAELAREDPEATVEEIEE